MKTNKSNKYNNTTFYLFDFFLVGTLMFNLYPPRLYRPERGNNY